MVIRVNVSQVIDNLVKDHDFILNSLKILYKIIDADKLNPNDVKLLIDFFDSFIDKCHHAKEEFILFPTINLRLFPFEGSPVYVMVSEHGISRYLIRVCDELLKAWIESGSDDAKRALVDYLRLLADHLTQHINKENNVLFPKSMDLDYVESSRSIDDIEKEANHERWIKEISELMRKYGIQ